MPVFFRLKQEDNLMAANSKAPTDQKSLRTLKKEIEQKTGKSTEQLYEEREKRVREAICLKESDRVPVRLETHAFPAVYTGVPVAASFYEPAVWMEATRKTILDFEPDIYQATVGFYSGKTLELIDPQHLKWPGGDLPPDVSHQAIEQEYMKAAEYDLFLDDPTDFTLRYLIPRGYAAMATLAKLPYLGDKFYAVPFLASIVTARDFRRLGKILIEAGKENARMARATANFDEEMALLGFPQGSHGGGAGSAPFDTISDFYRGMHGAMLDMYRCPDKLLAACDRILKRRIATASLPDPTKRGNPKMSFLGLHRGAEGFMSRKQFEKFYWPGLKQALLCTVSLGIVPMILCEGKYGDRLEYFLEMPKGKVVCIFDQTDMNRAKDVLKDHVCIGGNVPSSLLQLGSSQDVEDYCSRLIRVCGKGGGFILSAGSSIDLAKPGNIRTMMEAPKKYSSG
jgi:hypothetical protein